MNFEDQRWDTVIDAKQNPLSLNLKQIVEYRDLIYLFVKRDIATTYKQTILGPLWYLFQPVFTTILFMIVFRHVASLGTDDIPPVLFYLAGTILWYFFSNLLISQARVFYANKDIFGKVYFPRLTVPIAIIFGELIKFLIQFVMFVIVFVFFLFKGYTAYLSVKLLLLPIILLWLILLATGLGLMISSVTNKYRDLAKAMEFFLSLFMYATPIVYPLSEVPEGFKLFFILNPITAIIESFRKVCFGTGDVSATMILYSVLMTAFFVFIGVILFNKNEKKFIDVI